jgi:predicted nucleotidyltransferase
MSEPTARAAVDLPADVSRALDDFVAAARDALGDTLEAIVLFGSAVEGALRATSDVNVIVVLSAFERARAERLRPALHVASAAIQLRAMFLLREEIAAAAEAFAQKFDDVRRRRRVLWGRDPFATLTVSREALRRRIDQVLLNLALRLRAAYVESVGEERLALLVAEAAGPLRTAAASLLELQGRRAASPRAALGEVVAALGEPQGQTTLARLSEAREHAALPEGQGAETLLALIALAGRLRAQLRALA